jgi:hypothetical protein
VLDYDELLNTPAASLRRVLTELDLNTGFEEAAVDEIADASLRHHDGHAVDCESARAATGLYAMIRGGLPNAPIPVTELPRGDVDDLTFRMAAALLDHRAEQVRVGTLHATALEVIARRDSQLAEVQANEARLGELYTQAEAVIHEREAQLRALQARLEETSALYNHAEQVVHAQTARLTEMEGVLDRLRNSLLGRLALSRAIRPAGGGSEGTKEKIE